MKSATDATGFFGRVASRLHGRYLFEANLSRADGSSRFRSDSRWKVFVCIGGVEYRAGKIL